MTAEVEVWQEQAMPHDVPAEMCTLGALLLDAAVHTDVLDILQPPDFYRPAHQIVYEAAAAVRTAGNPVDALTVAAELTRTGEITRVGGAPYLHTLIASVPTAANGAYYARIVRERSIIRRVIEVGGRIVQRGRGTLGGWDDAGELVGQVWTDVATLAAPQRRAAIPAGPLLAAVAEDLANPRTVAEVFTGFSDLDALLYGLHRGRLYVIAARPGAGKSTLAQDIARHNAVKKDPAERRRVLFCTLEMSREDVMINTVCAEAGVSAYSARRHELGDTEWARIAAVFERVYEASLFIDDDETCSLASIRAQCAEAARQGTPFDLLIIDYLQLLRAAGKFSNRQEEVASLSRGLKLLAKELNIPIVVCAQLNRGSEQRSDKRPMLSDLRESGAVEQDADAVILIHRPDMYETECARAGEADFILAKNRQGPTANITVAAQLHFARFADMAPESWSPTKGM